MASPHAAGVAALIISRFGNAGLPKGHMRPGAVQAMLKRTADPMACPANMSIYAPFPLCEQQRTSEVSGRDGTELVQRERPDQRPGSGALNG
jgi:hypothetical protein